MSLQQHEAQLVQSAGARQVAHEFAAQPQDRQGNEDMAELRDKELFRSSHYPCICGIQSLVADYDLHAQSRARRDE